VLCYDLIPILFPQFFAAADVAVFHDYWLRMLPSIDKVICNSHCVARDLARFRQESGLPAGDIAVVPLGYWALPTSAFPGNLAAGLKPNRFALFVSTIEPRKGHATLIAAWRRLLDAGIPQQHRFKLVFVGRPGWMVEDILRGLAESSGYGGTVVHLSDLDDEPLAALYEAAAFCVYPSLYEGFGLPIVEAFSHGKAVLASTGGAVPETVGEFSPCLDPTDVDAWETMLRLWIEEPQARAPYEAKIRSSFNAPSWEDAATQFFAAARG
jgi:glycosyltransferase involved in cell wall biosynthesis